MNADELIKQSNDFEVTPESTEQALSDCLKRQRIKEHHEEEFARGNL
jgi:hypothetical protein